MGAVRVGLVGLGLALAGAGCDDFLAFDTLRCGNGVIEPAADEDCDGLPARSPYRCGDPGTEAACRLVCDGDDGCPGGWRCGSTGLCAAAAGRFDGPVVTRLDGETIDLADLDGDGRLDVVSNQRGSLGVAYGRGDGAFDEVDPVPVPRANLRPAVGDADGDGRADVALLDGAGLLVLRGTESRTLEPVVAPSAEVGPVTAVVGVRAAAPYTADEVVTLTLGPAGARFAAVDRELDAAAVEALVAGRSRPTLRAVRLDGGEGLGAEALALTFAGHPEVLLLDLACAEAGCALTVRDRLTLADGRGAAQAGVFAADLNRDGWPDLIAQAAEAQALQVAWGAADGFGPLMARPAFNAGGRGGNRPSLAAVVDLGGDARPDLLLSGAVLLLTGPDDSPTTERVFVPARPYIHAGAADLDADGAPDVFGLVDGSLSFALTRDDGLYLELASGVTDVAGVAAGDLDGNRLTDLVVERRDGGLAVIYGQADGSFGAPAPVARFAGEMRWAVVRAVGQRGVDATDDLVVFADGRRYSFAGNAQRQLAAPIHHDARPQGVAIGRFAEGPAVFVAGRTTALERVDSLLPAEQVDGADPTLAPLEAEGCAPDALAASGELRTVDWDRDGVDEVLHFDHVAFGAETVGALQWISPGAGGARCRMVALLDRAYSARDFDRVDLDGDGADEVVALLGPSPTARGPLAPAVAVWPLDGERAGEARVFADEIGIEHGAVIDLGAGRALVMVADGALHRARLVDGALEFTALAAAPRGVIDGARGDVDGDGLDDLVLKTATSVLVLPQQACGARAAWDGTCARVEAW